MRDRAPARTQQFSLCCARIYPTTSTNIGVHRYPMIKKNQQISPIFFIDNKIENLNLIFILLIDVTIHKWMDVYRVVDVDMDVYGISTHGIQEKE